MFHDGDLQSGIALALSHTKLLACFVTVLKLDDTQESSLWEEDYLQDVTITPLLSSKAVLLRIQAKSQEADYLSAFCPITKIPTLVIIHDGRLREYLADGITREDFQRRLRAVLDPSTRTLSQPAEPLSATSSNAEPIVPGREAVDPRTSSNISAQSTTSPATQPAAIAPAPTSTVQNVLEDQRRRLEADKKAKDAFEKAERRAKATVRRAEAEVAVAGANPDSAKAKQLSYAQQQKKRQQEARLERERIIREIENDKALRREKEERRKALAKSEAEGDDGAGGLVDQQLSSESSTPMPIDSNVCAVQVRSFDGSTLRARFTSQSTLSCEVRKWVDENRIDGDSPYTFKQIIAPLPSRAFTISEEDETLQSLGLAPSATLVMIPVHGFIAAYNAGPNVVSRGISAGFNVVSGGVGLVSGGVGMVAGSLGTFLGVGQPRPGPTEAEISRVTAPGATNTAAREPATNIRTLRDQQAKLDKQQFYNGNTLNFEPRKDQDDARD